MPEYIEREAVLKTLEKSLLFCENELDTGEYRKGCIAAIQDDIGNIKHLPTADVVEVVRCKDCEKWDTSNKLLRSCACSRWSQSMPYPRLTDPDDFCSYGVRKEGAEK